MKMSSKAKDNSQALTRRTTEWLQNGDLNRLLSECRKIQSNLRPMKYPANMSKLLRFSHAKES